ncbi:MAG TPA: ATP-dependent DNA helicase [Terriglobales bacterium]|nr:ATP-dependent DNA helicase [Terriglobales bacterium]
MTSTASPARKIVPDERQQQAIGHVDGPMLVIAGAGTGKTTVLTQRLANLIREGHARPDEIVALTYTDNSAAEMMARVRGELKGTAIDGLQACTFHAWCNGLLHRRGAGFGVLDDKDLWVYLRRRIRDLRLKHFVRAANVGQFLDSLLDFMRRCQDELVGPAEYALYVERLERGEVALPRVARSKNQTELEEVEILERCQEIARVFATVENMLLKENLGTFGHMITKAYQLLKNDPALLEEERRRTRFLLVDEFQDANFAQVEILSLLAGPEANVFAVGDADQAIYQFRGASSEAFTLFMRNFPTARVVALEKNRRSLSPILGCAFGIVNENPAVFGQTFSQKRISISYQRAPLESLRDEEAKRQGETAAAPPVEIVTWRDKEVEAADLARRIQKKRKDNDKDKDKDQRCRWSDFAVLYRQHNHRDELVKELAERGIPFSIEGLDVLDTPEVRDVVACLTAAVSPNDHASLFRVAALPQFGISPMELRAAMRAVRRQELDLRTVLGRLAGGPAVLETVEKVHREVKKDGVRASFTANDALSVVIRHFDLQRSALLVAFVKFVESWLKKAIAETGSPSEFLEYLDYFVQAGGTIPLPRTEEDAVQLLTAHAAKGLEFQHVAIIRGSSVSFPTAYHEPLIAFPTELRRADASAPGAVNDDKTRHEEEERRLFYVAMTRAKDTLAIYAHQGRGKKDPKPTQFLREFMVHPAYKKFWSTHPAAAVQDRLFAEEEQRIAVPQSTVAAWLLMPPSASFVSGLSASAIEIYEECPLRFKLEREWNLPRDVPASLQYGAAVHRILHTFYDAQRYGREIGDDDLIEQFRSDLASAGIADRYQYELYLRQGMEQLRQFFEWARSAEPPEVIETERRFELQVGSAKLAGRVDRIDRTGPDSVAIVDYKTGKPKSQEDADKSLQLSLYALAARETWGKRADCLIFHNLENNTPVHTTRTDAELDAAKLRVLAASDGIAQGKFAPKVGYHCAFCPYRNLCPATEKIVAGKIVTGKIGAPQKKSASRVN